MAVMCVSNTRQIIGLGGGGERAVAIGRGKITCRNGVLRYVGQKLNSVVWRGTSWKPTVRILDVLSMRFQGRYFFLNEIGGMAVLVLIKC
jgi:hypothetical protein